MTDFIWKYVEKYGKMEDCLKDILSDAFSALEKAIDEIPSNYAGRDVAKVNYDKFSGMIF